MIRTRDNIIYHELIGLEVKIISHLDPSLTNRRGIVVDEGMNVLKILDYEKNKVITVPKKGGIFMFTIPETQEVVYISGTQIIGRPEDRLKRIKN